MHTSDIDALNHRLEQALNAKNGKRIAEVATQLAKAREQSRADLAASIQRVSAQNKG